MIFQDPYSSLDPRLKVHDIIAEGMQIHHLVSSKKEEETMVQRLLRQVGLNPEHAGRYVHEFSGGQRQRIGIARALAVDPEIIFADEPTGNLDSHTSREVMELMRQVVYEQKKTLVMVTHDNGLASYADRVFHISDGKIVKIEGGK